MPALTATPLPLATLTVAVEASANSTTVRASLGISLATLVTTLALPIAPVTTPDPFYYWSG